MTSKERTARYRARLRGEDVPVMKRGPKEGYTQSPEHIAKRTRWGDEHHAWRGDDVRRIEGRKRAERRFTAVECSLCAARPAERHHIDGNPLNNEPGNIAILCRPCHVAAHRA
jgi:hypothetical protein